MEYVNLMYARGCIVICLLALFAGCGDDGMDRIQISGTVVYNGVPVENGAIFFEPTASVGQIAPTVYLPVRNGKFDTGAKGPVKGTYMITVGGFDNAKSKVDSDGITHTEQLFPDYRFEAEISRDKRVMDIEVPQAKTATTRR
jgi:hypothetical protein